MSTDVINLGVQLWNQTSNIIKYQDTGFALNERLYKFLLDFSKLQAESFQSQKKLCEKYTVDIQKSVGVDNTYAEAFNNFVRLFQKLVDKECLISDAFEVQAYNTVKGLLDEQKKKIKKWKGDRDRFNTEMKSQTRIIEEEMKRYRDKYREMIKFKTEAERIEADKTLSRLHVEKAITNYQQKQSEFERSRNDYSMALEQFNLYRKNHFNTTLPLWGSAGYTINSERAENTQNLMNVITDRFGVFVEQVTRLHSELAEISATISCDEDLQNLIKLLENDEKPPGDIPFKDLANDGLSGGGSSLSGHGSYSNPDQIYASANEPYLTSVSAVDNIEKAITNMVVGENAGQINNYQKKTHNEFQNGIQSSAVYSAISAITGKARRISLSATSGPPSMPPAPSSNPTSNGLASQNLFKKFFNKRTKTLSGLRNDDLSSNQTQNKSDNGIATYDSNGNRMADSSDFTDSETEDMDSRLNQNGGQRNGASEIRSLNNNIEQVSCLPSHYASLPVNNGKPPPSSNGAHYNSIYDSSNNDRNNNDYNLYGEGQVIGECVALYDFEDPDLPEQYFAFVKDEKFYLLSSPEDEKNGWYKVKHLRLNTTGYVPISFMEVFRSKQAPETVNGVQPVMTLKKPQVTQCQNNYFSPGKPARKGVVAISPLPTKRPPVMPSLANMNIDTDL